jgi:hypothetical protein
MYAIDHSDNPTPVEGAARWAHRTQDDFTTPEMLLPEQFAALWHDSRATAPEQALALAVLSQAVLDLARFRYARRRRFQRLYWEAYEWVHSEERSWPYAFLNLCDAFGLDAGAFRMQILRFGADPSEFAEAA